MQMGRVDANGGELLACLSPIAEASNNRLNGDLCVEQNYEGPTLVVGLSATAG